MTETRSAPRRRWRDDPLSIFLAAAALLLGGMYFLEQRQSDVLLDATRRAQAIAAHTTALDGCLFHSAGAKGRTLVIRCEQPTHSIAQAAAQTSLTPTNFDEVVFVGTDAQLVCTPDRAQWSDGCERRPLPR